MGKEIDLMLNYPRTKRDVKQRGATKTEHDRNLARKFGREFFDGERSHGYGGFHYNSKYWKPVIPTFKKYYNLTKESSILDVGCAKGFMLHDFAKLISGITVKGVDISDYAIEHTMDDVKPHIQKADAKKLPFENNTFDLVISITTVHNLERDELILSLKEIERVRLKHAFITVDAYRNQEEREAMEAWNLTARTVLHVDEWKELFKEAGYTGDYYWFMP